jgi:hypothetical protein
MDEIVYKHCLPTSQITAIAQEKKTEKVTLTRIRHTLLQDVVSFKLDLKNRRHSTIPVTNEKLDSNITFKSFNVNVETFAV